MPRQDRDLVKRYVFKRRLKVAIVAEWVHDAGATAAAAVVDDDTRNKSSYNVRLARERWERRQRKLFSSAKDLQPGL